MFMPKTALAYVEAEGNHDDKLIEAKSQWIDEQSQLGEGFEPHYQRLFVFQKISQKINLATLPSRCLAPC